MADSATWINTITGSVPLTITYNNCDINFQSIMTFYLITNQPTNQNVAPDIWIKFRGNSGTFVGHTFRTMTYIDHADGGPGVGLGTTASAISTSFPPSGYTILQTYNLNTSGPFGASCFMGQNIGINDSNPTQKLTVTAGNVLSSGSFAGSVTNVSNFSGGGAILTSAGSSLDSHTFIGCSTHGGGGGVGFVTSRGGITDTSIQVYTNTALGGFQALDTPGPYVNPGGTSWTNSSDERLKENLIDLEDGTLEKITNVRTVKFNWKNRAANKQSIGIIAQDILEIFPEVVNTDSEGFYGVEYTLLIPVLLKAIKELKNSLDNANQEIAEIKNKININ